MSDWRDTTLGDFLTLQRGFDLTQKGSTPGDFPVISSGGSNYTTDIAKVDGPGVVTGRKGVLGKVHWSEGPYWPHDTTLWVKDFKGSNPRFVYYLLQTLRLADLDAGAANPTLNRNHAHLLPIRVPGPINQAAIASSLRALDDLIENNRRRVAVLEEMARAIYREWFVKFCYPGHEDVPLVDSALGPIPEGWEVSTCGAELNFTGGGTPSKSDPAYWDGGTVAWYTPTDLTKTGWRYSAPSELAITEQGLAKSSAKMFPAGSVLMTSRATLGVLAIATTEATTNQGFIVILPDERWSPSFIYEWLESKAGELAALGTGATFKEITKGSFKRFPFVVPDRSVLNDYRAATEPVEGQVHVLEQQIRNLSSLRDLLLPKLVTGQIDVSSLDLDALVEGQVA
ncbi:MULTISPECIES: restriction endonuclease subunit S [unclassified Aeromicrobium]|uniref:restriction endonuclease subunit S n=1 Tax=unclassified Aeromicrobium TaxID=2633570 RepID=UPI00396B2E5F